MNQNLFDPSSFRAHFSGLVGQLCRRFGYEHLERAEDAVQSALLKATELWAVRGVPDNPLGWLYRTAMNAMIDEMRRVSRHDPMSSRMDVSFIEPEPEALERAFSDGLLDMVFVVCDPQIPAAGQLVFSLKVLLGFSTHEIATRLFLTEANVHQRLSRARNILRKQCSVTPEINLQFINQRRPSVLATLYALFSEGFHSSHPNQNIRRELCEEAIQLTHLLIRHPLAKSPEVFALLALMCLHYARIGARQDRFGALLLLEEQNYAAMDHAYIEMGIGFLAQSAEGSPTRWHAEAGIAAEYCLASSHQEINWRRILEGYDLLVSVSPGPLQELNRVVALAEVHGCRAGLEALDQIVFPAWLDGAYHVAAVRADLQRRLGDVLAARRSLDVALKLAPESIQSLLRKRFQDLLRVVQD